MQTKLYEYFGPQDRTDNFISRFATTLTKRAVNTYHTSHSHSYILPIVSYSYCIIQSRATDTAIA